MWEAGASSDPYCIPVTGWLISHSRGTVVFDCGMHTDLRTDSARLENTGSAKLEALSQGAALVGDA